MAKKAKRGAKSLVAPDNKPATSVEALVLPSFAESHCQVMSVCGYIDVADAGTAKFDEDAQFGDGFWLHVVSEKASKKSSQKADRVHLHVDLKRRFRDQKKKPSSTLQALTAEIAKFVGKSAACWIRAEYLIPVDDLPNGGVVHAFLGLSTQAGKHSLAFRGAFMRIEDAQLDELQWVLADDGKSVLVTMDANLEKTINNVYLDEAAAFLNDAFQRIVLDERPKNE